MDPLSIAGGALGIIGGIGGLFGGGKANKKLKALMADNPAYQQNPLAAKRLGYAEQLLNARMPGSMSAERNIYTNQANQLANIDRNATDSSQALALGAASQAQTNQAFNQLGQQEAQDYYNRLGVLQGAQQGMIDEQGKVFQDRVRRWEDRGAIEGAMQQNTANTWKSLSNLGFSLAGSNLFGVGGKAGGAQGGGGMGGQTPTGGGGMGGAKGDFDPMKLMTTLFTGTFT